MLKLNLFSSVFVVVAGTVIMEVIKHVACADCMNILATTKRVQDKTSLYYVVPLGVYEYVMYENGQYNYVSRCL